MRNYEIMYIVRPNIEDDAKKEVMDRFHGILTNNGAEIEKVDEMGKRRLAYEINDYRDGYYVVVNMKSTPEAIAEFDRLAKISDDIIRHIAVKDEE